MQFPILHYKNTTKWTSTYSEFSSTCIS